MDKIKFYKAAAILKSFRGNLPRGDIDLNHVDDYHSVLDSLQEQVGQPLDEFRIPKSALKERAIPQSHGYDSFGNQYGDPYRFEPYCDGHVFHRQVDAVILFIDTYISDLSK